jgi:hypothetical protein
MHSNGLTPLIWCVFSQKLLARTQARKAALAKKREEVAGRSPIVVAPRRPLAENKPNATTPVKPPPTTPNPVHPPKSVFYEKFAKQASLQQKECFIELGEAKNALKPTPKKRELLQDGEKGVALSDNMGSSEPKPKKIARDEVVNMDSPSVKVGILFLI